jgi:hypothetical protein
MDFRYKLECLSLAIIPSLMFVGNAKVEHLKVKYLGQAPGLTRKR